MYLNEYFRPLVVGRCGFDFYTQGFGGGRGGEGGLVYTCIIINKESK